MKKLDVNLGERSYSIIIGNDLLDQSGIFARQISCGHVLLVSNTTVFPLYGEKVVNSFKQAGLEVTAVIIPDGETYKTLEQASQVLDQAIDAGMERGSLVAALGGGVVGDLAGFAASVYMRGIDVFQIPTTLLAQVDSSVGGKVAVNHPAGKNLVGSFHQPRMVLIDINTLTTLEEAEYRSGLAEVVKYGIIYDRGFFAFLENNQEEINKLQKDCLQELIYRSCTIKADIVGQDERETGIRAILNLGHTFGHSLEKLSGYSLRHGEAVAAGTIAACYLSHNMGYLSAEALERIQQLYLHLGLISPFPDFANDSIYREMLHDKKVVQGTVRIIIPRDIGSYSILPGIEWEQVEQALVDVRRFYAEKAL